MQLDEPTRADLAQGIDMLQGMLAGIDPDPALLHYIGMLCQSLAEDLASADADAPTAAGL